MKEANMKHATLVGATTLGGPGKASTAMDVGSIASVTDAGVTQPGEAPSSEWAIDETGPPIDEEGNQIEGYIDGQLNFVKGKGEGKGECWNCGKTGHRAADCIIRRQ